MVSVYRTVLVIRAGLLTGSLFVLPLASCLQKQSGAEGWSVGSEGLPTKCLLFLPAITHSSSALPCLPVFAFCGLPRCGHTGRSGTTKILLDPSCPFHLLIAFL